MATIGGHIVFFFKFVLQIAIIFILYALPGTLIGAVLQFVPCYPLIALAAAGYVAFSLPTFLSYKALTVAAMLFFCAILITLISWFRSVRIYEVRKNPGYRQEKFVAIAFIGMIIALFMRLPHIIMSNGNIIPSEIVLFVGILVLCTTFTETRGYYKKIIQLGVQKHIFTLKDLYTLIRISDNDKEDDIKNKQRNLLTLATSMATHQNLFLLFPAQKPTCFVETSYFLEQVDMIHGILEVQDYILVCELQNYLPLPIPSDELKAVVLDGVPSAALGHDDNQEIICKAYNDDHLNLCECCGKFMHEPIETPWGEVCSDACADILSTMYTTTHIVRAASHHKTVSISVLSANTPQLSAMLKKQSYYVNRPLQSRHGYAAEVVNTDIDRLFGRKAEVLGANNAKNGPDHIVNGQEIQCKYYNSAKKSIDAAFDESGYRYYDSSRAPMQIEVPRDQYQEAAEYFADKIRAGKVPGVTDPNEASRIVRCGYLNYKNSVNIARFGTIDSLTYDALNSAARNAYPASISALIVFSVQLFQDDDPQHAFFVALQTGKAAFTQGIIRDTISAQTSKFVSEQNLRIDPLKAGEVVGQGVAFVLGNAGSFMEWYQGNIASAELGTQLASSAVGLAASRATISLLKLSGLPGLIIGGVVGAVAGQVTQDLLTDFTQDDEKAMQKIFLQELSLLSRNYLLTNDEISIIHTAITENQYHMMLRNMFFSSDHYQYAASVILPLVGECYTQRPTITE